MSEGEKVQKELDDLLARGLTSVRDAADEAALQSWKTAYLGKTSPVTLAFQKMGTIEKELRPQVGQRANQVKNELEAALEAQSKVLAATAMERQLSSQSLDITLPGRVPAYGRLNPSTQTINRMLEIFAEMGFQEYRSRDVETDEYNFELLNIPAHHPARDMWDTFHTTIPGTILRTHTSNGQIHAMREHAPKPIRFALPGMCYRYEQVNASHEAQFNQLELIAVGHNITMGDLIGTIEGFARRMFDEHVHVRMRPSYFPFTEPSAEVDMECYVCGGKGCPVCKHSGWLEIAGCGMIHPTVLQNGGYDPREFTGFAAGLGPERITMLKNQISDIRYLFQNDIRFLEQFS